MRLIVNGKQQKIGDAATIADVIKSLGYEGDFFAVALNRACVPRKNYAATPVNENDEIEILSPMQGG
jgi:sulfur carrier protein